MHGNHPKRKPPPFLREKCSRCGRYVTLSDCECIRKSFPWGSRSEETIRDSVASTESTKNNFFKNTAIGQDQLHGKKEEKPKEKDEKSTSKKGDCVVM